MKVTAKITKHVPNAGRLRAFATICLADAFLVTGVRVVECEKGMMVFMPSMKDKEDEYRDVCFPIKPELRSQIDTAVLNAYDADMKVNEQGDL
ncbi:MAG: SpoVG family protein [Roseburia sp.]|jgi:stage V sporulation protein G|nr:SpoVG family protein [Roseburia sp.]